MKKYICTVCEYIYDPEQGESEKKTLNRTKDKTKRENY